MTDHTQTVTNTMQVFGVSPGSLWGVAVFGTDLWGVDEDVWTDTDKQVTEALGLTDAIAFKDIEHLITDSLTLSTAVNPVMRTWGIWDYVFTGPTTEGEDQSDSTWTATSDNDATWSDVNNTSTSWSDA